MTALTWPTIVESAADPGWRRDTKRGASETISPPYQHILVHHCEDQIASQPTLDLCLTELNAEPWFESVLGQLSRFLSYGADWNGYGERAISKQAVMRTIFVLHQVAMGGPEPDLFPVHHGGVQIEWYYNGTEIEVEIPPAGPVEVYVSNPDGSSHEDSVGRLDHPIWDELRASISRLKAA